jgi:hypothetical protein
VVVFVGVSGERRERERREAIGKGPEKLRETRSVIGYMKEVKKKCK